MHTAVYQETSLETRGQGVFIVSWSHKHKLSWWCSDKEYTCRSRRHRFDPWVGKISWRKRWQSMPVFLPGKFHWERSLVGYSPWDRKRVGHDLVQLIWLKFPWGFCPEKSLHDLTITVKVSHFRRLLQASLLTPNLYNSRQFLRVFVYTHMCFPSPFSSRKQKQYMPTIYL